jgi:Polysaccharide biosynthesis enzyme WcbI
MILGKYLRGLFRTRPKRRSKFKVVVVGNCQARPLAKILSVLNADIEITAVAIVHLLKSEQAEDYLPFFEEADFIVAQLVADNYPCDFVRTPVLKEVYGDKLISIVNLYYAGYNPELIYIRQGSAGTLKSPLGEYHNKTFLDTWKEGGTVEKALKRHFEIQYNEEKYSSLIAESLDELKRREKLVDIAITDLIEGNLAKERLFFTFNHPCMSLLVNMAKRILTRAGLKISAPESVSLLKEPLDKIIVPVNPFVKKSLALQFEDVSTVKGVECIFESDGNVTVSGYREYRLPEIAEKYFKIYDKNLVIK